MVTIKTDPDAEVIVLSPGTLMATNRYICEVCHKGFQRDQNLQLHRRGHNLPWKLKQKSVGVQVKKRVYVCPEPSCVHHDPSRALGDLTGIKKHFCRKHGEKKWKCDKCSKRYAVQSDWKAHAKICGTKEYRCDCGTIFSRKDSFITHRAFCDALAEENYRVNHGLVAMVGSLQSQTPSTSLPSSNANAESSVNLSISSKTTNTFAESSRASSSHLSLAGGGDPMVCNTTTGSAYMSATALLQKAVQMGSKASDDSISPILLRGFTGYSPFKKAETTQSLGLISNAVHYHGLGANADASQGGFFDPVNNDMFIREAGEGRSTVDFLGLGPGGGGGGPSMGYGGGDIGGGVEHDMHSYQHFLPGQSVPEKPMWKY
ncbi:Zinc finger protein MAGPIE [Acorus gramineus]|uniref:Protein EARLY HEADING DATE 2 n=1 Tax=Acorus gramineus TaxID=55184 RepID=A0AAV9B343_ACOGR|nr:Zinc finger protein MAGPIE [Acorus gramineus]